MKNIVKYFLALAVLTAAFASCSKKEPIVGTQDKDGFFLNRTSMTLTKGTSGNLTATVSPKGAGTVSWSSDNEEVATVKDGVVTAVSGGDAVISAKYGSKTLDCNIHVSSDVTVVTLDEHNVEFDKGDTRQLSFEIGPEDVNVDVKVSWSSTDEAVLTVDDEGLVTAVGGGTASIVVNVNGVTDVCEFFSHCYPTGVEIAPLSAKVAVGKTTQFTATLLPADCTETLEYEWSVEDSAIASVDEEGVVTALSAGTTKVIVKAGEFSAEADLVVKNPQTVTVTATSTDPATAGDVTISFGGTVRWGGSSYGVEHHGTGSFTVSVPDGMVITKITFRHQWKNSKASLSANTGTYTVDGSNHTWVPTEDTSSVTLTNAAGEIDILNWTVTYE